MSDQPLWSGWRLPRPQKMSSDGQEKRRYQRDRERYQFLMGILETLEQKVPGAIEGKPNLSFADTDTSTVFEALHQSTPPKALRKTHNFLVKGLENGHEKLKWRVTIPSPLVTVVRKPPRVTTSSFSDLHRWDALVEAHDTMPSVKNLSDNALRKWLVGRWLFQLIREGALLHKRYLEQMPEAFEQGLSFASGTGFLTLADCIQSANAGEEEKEQDEASDDNPPPEPPSETPIEKELRFHYRRLYLSPMSQLLLLNTYQDIGNAWPRTASKSRVSVEQCLMFYIKHIAVDTPPASISILLTMARTASALDMPPLLTHYASKADSSLSLRPSSWQRLLNGNVLIAHSIDNKDEDEDVYVDFQTTHQASTSPSDQLKQLRQLQQCFSASLVGQTGRREAIDNINAFLEVSNSNGVMVTMLANWCKKLMQKGGRVKSKLVASTAETYLSTIARPLVAHQPFGDVQAASADEWEALYENVLNSAKNPTSRAKMRNRLNEFHHFLVDSYAFPHIDLDSAQAEKQRVDVNIITPAELRRALALIETSRQPERFRTMQKLALILGYRLGIRRSECAGLQIKDVAYLFENDPFGGEIIIRSNDYRKGKSYSATRRLPLWLLMPEEQRDLINWVKRRQGEITTQQVTKQLLFCRSGNGRLLLEDKALFQPIQIALKTVSGDHTLRYHHLRHSFVTFTLLRLLERMPGELLPDAWVLEDHRNIAMPNTDADISALAGLAPQYSLNP